MAASPKEAALQRVTTRGCLTYDHFARADTTTEHMYRIIHQVGVDRWGRSFLSGVVLALAVATLAMFVAIPVWKEVRRASTPTAMDSGSIPPPFGVDDSIPVGTDADVASSSALGI
jgi:hypothetical protein